MIGQYPEVDQYLPVRNSACFSPANLAKLMEHMCEFKMEAGAFVYRENDPSDKLYYVFKGSVKQTKLSEDGKDFVLHLFNEGDFFGQTDPFENAVQQYNAKAVEPSVIGFIHRQDLELLLWQDRSLSLDFMNWMGLMHRQTQSKFRDILLYGKAGALCSTLIRLANTYGQTVEDGIVIRKKLTHSELADFIGSARESVNRLLMDLRKKQVVDMVDGQLVIRDIEYLRHKCNCEQCPIQVCRV